MTATRPTSPAYIEIKHFLAEDAKRSTPPSGTVPAAISTELKKDLYVAFSTETRALGGLKRTSFLTDLALQKKPGESTYDKAAEDLASLVEKPLSRADFLRKLDQLNREGRLLHLGRKSGLNKVPAPDRLATTADHLFGISEYHRLLKLAKDRKDIYNILKDDAVKKVLIDAWSAPTSSRNTEPPADLRELYHNLLNPGITPLEAFLSAFADPRSAAVRSALENALNPITRAAAGLPPLPDFAAVARAVAVSVPKGRGLFNYCVSLITPEESKLKLSTAESQLERAKVELRLKEDELKDAKAQAAEDPTWREVARLTTEVETLTTQLDATEDALAQVESKEEEDLNRIAQEIERCFRGAAEAETSRLAKIFFGLVQKCSKAEIETPPDPGKIVMALRALETFFDNHPTANINVLRDMSDDLRNIRKTAATAKTGLNVTYKNDEQKLADNQRSLIQANNAYNLSQTAKNVVTATKARDDAIIQNTTKEKNLAEAKQKNDEGVAAESAFNAFLPTKDDKDQHHALLEALKSRYPALITLLETPALKKLLTEHWEAAPIPTQDELSKFIEELEQHPEKFHPSEVTKSLVDFYFKTASDSVRAEATTAIENEMRLRQDFFAEVQYHALVQVEHKNDPTIQKTLIAREKELKDKFKVVSAQEAKNTARALTVDQKDIETIERAQAQIKSLEKRLARFKTAAGMLTTNIVRHQFDAVNMDTRIEDINKQIKLLEEQINALEEQAKQLEIVQRAIATYAPHGTTDTSKIKTALATAFPAPTTPASQAAIEQWKDSQDKLAKVIAKCASLKPDEQITKIRELKGELEGVKGTLTQATTMLTDNKRNAEEKDLSKKTVTLRGKILRITKFNENDKHYALDAENKVEKNPADPAKDMTTDEKIAAIIKKETTTIPPAPGTVGDATLTAISGTPVASFTGVDHKTIQVITVGNEGDNKENLNNIVLRSEEKSSQTMHTATLFLGEKLKNGAFNAMKEAFKVAEVVNGGEPYAKYFPKQPGTTTPDPKFIDILLNEAIQEAARNRKRLTADFFEKFLIRKRSENPDFTLPLSGLRGRTIKGLAKILANGYQDFVKENNSALELAAINLVEAAHAKALALQNTRFSNAQPVSFSLTGNGSLPELQEHILTILQRKNIAHAKPTQDQHLKQAKSVNFKTSEATHREIEETAFREAKEALTQTAQEIHKFTPPRKG